MILGGCDRLATGELVPRRSDDDALNVEMLAMLAEAAGLDGDPPPEPDDAPCLVEA